MRILLVSDFYPPTIGGLERHVARLAKALVALGHDVEVATSATPQRRDDGPEDGVFVHRLTGWHHRLEGAFLDPNRPFPPPAPEPGLVRELRQVIDTTRPDVVHVHGWMTPAVAAAAEDRDTRVVATLHDSGMACVKRTLFWQDRAACDGPSAGKCVPCAVDHYGSAKALALYGLLQIGQRRLDRVDRFIAVASVLAEVTGQIRSTKGVPFEVIPNFIDTSVVPPADVPRPDVVPATGDYVLFVGTLGRFKGVHDLLSVWRNRRPDAELVLLGTEAPDTPTDLPPGVTMHTDVAHPEVMAAFRHCRFAVLPSRFPEPSPTVVLEPMAAGRPVIGARIGGIPDLIADDETGVLVPVDDQEALGDAICDLLTDRERCDRLGATAAARAHEFGQDAVVARIVEVYERTIERTPARLAAR